MTRIRIAGLCLLVAAAAGALTTASASAALPEFTAPFSKPFTATSKGSLFETINKTKLKCTSDNATGEVTGEKTGFMRITFEGCKVKKLQCNTPGTVPGTIVTPELSFKLGYINKANKEVGIDLIPSAGGPFLEYVCGPPISATVIGSVIGKITPINKKVVPPKFFTLNFKQSAGKQLIQNLEGEPIDILETAYAPNPFEETGLNSVEKITFGEVVSVIA